MPLYTSCIPFLLYRQREREKKKKKKKTKKTKKKRERERERETESELLCRRGEGRSCRVLYFLSAPKAQASIHFHSSALPRTARQESNPFDSSSACADVEKEESDYDRILPSFRPVGF